MPAPGRAGQQSLLERRATHISRQAMQSPLQLQLLLQNYSISLEELLAIVQRDAYGEFRGEIN